MDAFLAQWCWGQWFNEFVKDTFFNIMEKICEAVKCLASDVMINWQRTMRTARNNGFDQIVAAGYHENVNLCPINWSRATHGANNGFDHIARVVSIVVFLPQWCWSQFVNTSMCQVIQVSYYAIERICGAVHCLASDVIIDWPRATCNRANNGFDHGAATRQHEKHLGLIVPCLWWTVHVFGNELIRNLAIWLAESRDYDSSIYKVYWYN